MTSVMFVSFLSTGRTFFPFDAVLVTGFPHHSWLTVAVGVLDAVLVTHDVQIGAVGCTRDTVRNHFVLVTWWLVTTCRCEDHGKKEKE